MCKEDILMPINESFMEVFEVFMDSNQRAKIRANNVRQYVEGIIDLLLRDKIVVNLKATEKYEGINWKRKIKIIEDYYDRDTANNIREIFKIGGDGSHFNGIVREEELETIIEKAIHIVEEIFVNYFLIPEHKFGEENIFTIFSMLPLKHRIYILESVSKNYENVYIVDKLSLAYFKSGEEDKALDYLKNSLDKGVINIEFYEYKLNSLNSLKRNIDYLYEQNKNYQNEEGYMQAVVEGNLLVVGLPTSKDIFETARAVETFRNWFEEDKNKYPEFINLFFYLMQTDDRVYESKVMEEKETK